VDPERLDDGLPAVHAGEHTPRRIDRGGPSADLIAELDRTRAREYAVDDEENTVGVVCVAVALAGTDRSGRQRAVSVTMLKARATDSLRDAIVADRQELARTLSPSL
jgi:DNA-binding IclR family transcriptional regulator